MARSHESRRGLKLLGATAALAGSLVLAGCGNEHGASKTNVDAMPSYPVGTLEAAPTTSASLPPKAELVRQYVCNSIFIDLSAGEVIVRPITDPVSRRPLELMGIDAAGAQFAQPVPRNVEFRILNIDGSEDEDQALSPSDCSWQDVTVRSVHDKTSSDNDHFVLVDHDKTSHIDDGDTINLTGAGAVHNGLVHYDLGLTTEAQVDHFVDQL